MEKQRELSEEQLNSFHRLGSAMASCATLSMPGTYPQELKDCDINERGVPRNEVMGYIVTQPSGSQLAIETVFRDTKDSRHDGDLHVVNFPDKTITSFYRGWGTWEQYYGNQHHADKGFLSVGTEPAK